MNTLPIERTQNIYLLNTFKSTVWLLKLQLIKIYYIVPLSTLEQDHNNIKNQRFIPIYNTIFYCTI